MKRLISALCARADLDSLQVKEAVSALVSDEVSDVEKMAFLRALHEKGESAEEIAMFAVELLQRAVSPKLNRQKLFGPTLDVCGTGGDRKGFFNVSTAVMFVVAAGGACVLKHGNRSITSRAGAADVLEELGVNIQAPIERINEMLEAQGLAFFYAPAFHPAFKAIALVRKALAAEGLPTIFNMLGPLLNPALPDFQLAGVFNESVLPKYARALALLGRRAAWVVHGDGTDEITLTGSSRIYPMNAAKNEGFTIAPEDFGMQRCKASELLGGDCAENARILISILQCKDRGPKRDMVLLNAAAAFVLCGLAEDISGGIAQAAAILDSGRAMEKLDALRTGGC